MNASFGIDHPLLATHDIEGLRARLNALGFNMTAVGKHPWGTSTSLAMFDGCLLEIMGIYDASLIDEVPAGDFRFGRHVYTHLQQREGVALTALHSVDSAGDARRAADAGFTLAGHLEFGRDVTLPDGTQGRTKTTLALLPDPTFPRMSFFLCQQHRPDLIYVPEWLIHPNTVHGICGVNVVAQAADHGALHDQFAGLYGTAKITAKSLNFETANGALRVFTADSFAAHVAPLPSAVAAEQAPFIAGMDFSVADVQALKHYATTSGTSFTETTNGLTLNDPTLTANTVMRFLRS